MPFLLLYQQRQSTEGAVSKKANKQTLTDHTSLCIKLSSESTMVK